MAKQKQKSAKTIERLALKTVSIRLMDAERRLNDVERRNEQLYNKLVALEGEARSKFAAITQVSDLFVTLRKVLNQASAELAGAASYTQQEIAAMSSEEYRAKVLVPLNMGRRV
jgi:hypothetical protein